MIGSKVVVCYTQPLSVALGHVIKLFEVQSNPDVQDCERLPCLSSSSIPIIINSKCLFLEWMIDWIGGQSTLIKLGGLALGIISLYIVKSFSNPHRSWNYFMAGFCCWFLYQLILGLYTGTLVSIPYLVGVTTAILLLCGVIGLFSLAFLSVWRDKQRGLTGRMH